MDTTWLAVFRHIAHSGSFTAAADDLGYTQSAASRQVAALERHLGVRLFDRHARGVRLTEEGRFLLPHAEAVLDRIDAATSDLDALQRTEIGRLRVGGFATSGVTLLPRAIAAFRAAHPGVTLVYADGLTSHLTSALERDDLDLALINGYPDQLAGFAHLRPVRIVDEPMLVAMPPDHRLAGEESVVLDDLAGDEWIAGSATPEETLIGAALNRGFRPRVTHVVREWIAKQGFVAAGLGVTLVPALAAASVRSDVALVPLHPWSAPTRAVLAARSPDRDVPPVEAFLEHVRTVADELISTWRSKIPDMEQSIGVL